MAPATITPTYIQRTSAGILSKVKLPAYFGSEFTTIGINRDGTICRLFCHPHTNLFEIKVTVKGKPGYEAHVADAITHPQINGDQFNEKMQRITAALDSFL